MTNPVTKMFVPHLAYSDRSFRRDLARFRLLRAAVMVRQGRTANLPEDPFGTGPLRYRKEGGSGVLWSVGKDGVDDGGRENGPDIVLELKRTDG